jgi:PPOX class probable F420-dependent enzyme
MAAMTAARARADRFLAQEPVVWLSSVRPDGCPHIVPVWFTWDGEALVVFSKPGAQKVRNVRATHVVMLALGDADEDFDVGLIEARASVVDTPATLPEAHVRKYGRRMAALGLSAEDFLATYSTVLRIVPTRYLPWHGRTTPLSVQATSSIEEPRRPAVRETWGEPIAAV